MTVPRLKIAPRVTRKHGEVFVENWFPTSWQGEELWDAFRATGLVEWPDSARVNPREERYQDIEDEILERTFAAVRTAVAEAFVTTAKEVLARERQKPVSDDWTAVYIETAQGIMGYIEEMPGALAQGATIEETEPRLQEALERMLRANANRPNFGRASVRLRRIITA